MADMEDCMRRNNIRLVGFPGGVEGRHPEEFLEKWLIDHMAPETFTKMFAIDTTYSRSGATEGCPPQIYDSKSASFSGPGEYPGARTGPELSSDGNRISIYPDFSAATQKQRASFQPIKKRLRDLNLIYSMLYPAKLRIVEKGRTYFFTSPTEWLDTRGRQRDGASSRPP